MRQVRPGMSSAGKGSTPPMRIVGDPGKRSSTACCSVDISRISTASGSRPRSVSAARRSASVRSVDGQPCHQRSSMRGRMAVSIAGPCRLGSLAQMGCDPRHEILFEPVRIGPKTLRNRFYQVPHCTGFGVEKPWSQARHRAVKAQGGWAAVCTEYCTISAESDETPYVAARMWDDHDLQMLAVTAEQAHELGALAGIELSHTGAHGENSESRLPAAAPSQIAGDFAVGVVPRAMTRRDIRRVQDDWVTAARRSRTAGFDIVYVYGAHTYLPGQFLSPHYNRRTDEYGGSLANRARFWLETLEVVRAAVGDDCAIACRVAVDRRGALGVDLDEGLEFVSLADHLVDLWDVTVGSIGEWSLDSGPSARRSPTRNCPRRSARAGWTRSASASAATSASRRPTAADTSAAPRIRPPARSTGGDGIRSTCRRWRSPCTRWWSGPGRAAWSAPSRWRGAARGSIWSIGARWWVARWAGSRACRGWGSGAGWSRTGRCS